MFVVNMAFGGLFYKTDITLLNATIWLLWGAFYNKLYIKELLAKGWKPATDFDAEMIRTKVAL